MATTPLLPPRRIWNAEGTHGKCSLSEIYAVELHKRTTVKGCCSKMKRNSKDHYMQSNSPSKSIVFNPIDSNPQPAVPFTPSEQAE